MIEKLHLIFAKFLITHGFAIRKNWIYISPISEIEQFTLLSLKPWLIGFDTHISSIHGSFRVIITMLLIKFLKFKASFGWSLSNLVAFLRWNLFTYRNLWEWIDKPFEIKLVVPKSVQYPLPFMGFGQHLLQKDMTWLWNRRFRIDNCLLLLTAISDF